MYIVQQINTNNPNELQWRMPDAKEHEFHNIFLALTFSDTFTMKYPVHSAENQAENIDFVF